MKKLIKDKWLEGLKSGKYTHYKSSLRSNDDCFCALGVLCDIVDPNGWSKNDGRTGEVHWSHQMRYAFPTQDLLDDAGISPSQTTMIIQLNEKNNGFEEVIKYVEKHL